MSVLFKALQKAEKENEQRQAADGASGFDPSRLAGSGAIKMAGGRGINWRTAGMAAAFVLAVAIMAAFFLVSPVETPPARQVAALPPAPVQPAPVQPATPGTTETIPVLQPPAGTTSAPAVAPEAVAAATPATPAAPVAPVQTAAAPEPVAEPEAVSEPAPVEAVDAPEETPAPPAAAPKSAAPARVAAAPAAPAAPPRKQGMPNIAADSPARMLNPPISIQRTEFDLSGVGDAVQVREVSQTAQDNVGAGYSALVSGAYDMSLGFYDRALRDEPSSVMALLGRGAALQKMRRLDEAQAAYNRVLAIDPDNREALSNLTVILAENAPAEAIAKLLLMEKEYPTFSPIKAQLGLAYAKQGSMNAALDYLRRATALSPESVMYQYNMALVLDHLSLGDQAVVAYERVLANLAGGRSAPELSSTDIERRVRYLRTR